MSVQTKIRFDVRCGHFCICSIFFPPHWLIILTVLNRTNDQNSSTSHQIQISNSSSLSEWTIFISAYLLASRLLARWLKILNTLKLWHTNRQNASKHQSDEMCARNTTRPNRDAKHVQLCDSQCFRSCLLVSGVGTARTRTLNNVGFFFSWF